MPTEKLGLPTTSLNTAADVPKVVNDLANAIDEKTGVAGGIARLGANGKVLNADGTSAGEVTKKEFDTHVADYVKHPGAATSTNTGNAYVVTLNPAPAAYVANMGVVVTINADSTGAATLNVNGLGAKSIKKANGNDVTNLKANGIYTVRYNPAVNGGTGAFILQGEGGDYGNVTPRDVRNTKTFGTENGVQQGELDLSLLTSENIRKGIVIDGIEGSLAEMLVTPGTFDLSNVSTSVSTKSTTYVKAFEKIIKMSGVVRVSFSYMGSGTSGKSSYSRIYKNDIPVGIERIRDSASFMTAIEDIDVMVGDKIQIYHRTGDSSYAAYVSNFKISIDVINLVE